MRTLIDAVCPGCGDVHCDVWVEVDRPSFSVSCPRCDLPLVRRHIHAPGIVRDGIPGGLMVEHGLCNPDGTPRRYDSRSDMDREAKRRGLERCVEHTDGDPLTQRFV